MTAVSSALLMDNGKRPPRAGPATGALAEPSLQWGAHDQALLEIAMHTHPSPTCTRPHSHLGPPLGHRLLLRSPASAGSTHSSQRPDRAVHHTPAWLCLHQSETRPQNKG